MTDSERPATVSGDPRARRRQFGCVFLVLAVLAVVGVLVWIDSRHLENPVPNQAAPVEVPPEAIPPRPAQ